jgi:hypothetical protein
VVAHIARPHATELIAEFVVGRHLESTVEEMDRAMHPHPALSEAVAEAALAAPMKTPRPAPGSFRSRPRSIWLSIRPE